MAGLDNEVGCDFIKEAHGFGERVRVVAEGVEKGGDCKGLTESLELGMGV